MANTFKSIEGTLNEFPFPRTLQFLAEHNVTGRLALRRGDLTKVVFMVEGRPVNVDSTLRDETLGRYLIKKGRITEEDYERSIQIMIEQGVQQGAALVKLGCLSPRQLYHEVKAQTREKLLSCFAWVEGGFGFYPEVEFVEDIYRFETSLPELMREGIMRFFPPGALEKQLLKASPGPVAPVPDFNERISDFNLTEEESAIIFLIDGTKDLVALKKETRTYPQSLKLLYLLLVSGLIGSGGRPDPMLRSLGEVELSMPPLEDFLSPVSPETAAVLVEEELMSEEPPPAEEFAVSFETDSEEGGEWAEDETEIKEEPALGIDEDMISEDEVIEDWVAAAADEFEPEIPEPGPEGEAPAAGFEERRAGEDSAPAGTAPLKDEFEVLEFYIDIKSKDFFSLLGLDRDCDDKSVLRAYRKLRMEYDKERFGPDLSAEAQAKLEEIHAQLIRAFEALRTEADREHYLAGPGKPDQDPKLKSALKAEQCLQQGLGFVRRRDWPQAQKMFELALEASPEEPEYYGYLGWTIYSNPELDINERRERAKDLIGKAIELNPYMDSSHVFMAKILKEEGKTEEAAAEFQAALRCNPKCKEAERELKARELKQW